MRENGCCIFFFFFPSTLVFCCCCCCCAALPSLSLNFFFFFFFIHLLRLLLPFITFLLLTALVKLKICLLLGAGSYFHKVLVLGCFSFATLSFWASSNIGRFFLLLRFLLFGGYFLTCDALLPKTESPWIVLIPLRRSMLSRCLP